MTLYKQQVRALNLLYAIHSEKLVDTSGSIAILGGGAAGLTAALACYILGYKASLFEKTPYLCHLQYGCDTRWIHPHLYEWPEFGADRHYAGLPFLNWRAGTASEVSEQLLDAYNRVNDLRLRTFLAKDVSFPDPLKPLRLCWDGMGAGDEDFDAIIVAVGFGLERGVKAGNSSSYWRNDGLNQVDLTKPVTKYLISGVGDGGLTDLIRIKLRGYNQGRVINELVGDDATLLNALRRLRKDWFRVRGSKFPPGNSWLYDRYTSLMEKGSFARMREKIRMRLRSDTDAYLNGNAGTLRFALSLDKASVINTLIVFLLQKEAGFKYLAGPCKPLDMPKVEIDGVDYLFDQIVFRHGPDTAPFFSDAKLDDWNELQKRVSTTKSLIDTADRLWPAGWWGGEAKFLLRKENRVEFVAPATLTLANTFVGTLSDIISNGANSVPKFRIALHRVIKVNEEEVYQQTSRYAGTRTGGDVGRVFNIRGGIVGLAIRLGRPIIITKNNDFDRIWEKLHLEEVKARKIDPEVQSILAWPLFVPNRRQRLVSLVLFMDSSVKEFFSRERLEVVYNGCKGFIENVEKMKASQEVTFYRMAEFAGHPLKPSLEDNRLAAEYSESISINNESFPSYESDMTFRTIRSFDADLHIGFPSAEKNR